MSLEKSFGINMWHFFSCILEYNCKPWSLKAGEKFDLKKNQQ